MTITKKKVVQQVHCSQEPALYVHARTHANTLPTTTPYVHYWHAECTHCVFSLAPRSLRRHGYLWYKRDSHILKPMYIRTHAYTYTRTHSSHTLDPTSGTGRRGGPEKNGRSPCESSARRSTAWQRIAASHVGTTLWLAGQGPGLERPSIDHTIQQRWCLSDLELASRKFERNDSHGRGKRSSRGRRRRGRYFEWYPAYG